MSDSFNQLINYKEDTLLLKIKRKVAELFYRLFSKDNMDSSEYGFIMEFGKKKISNNEFLKIYEGVKTGEVELTSLNDEIVYKIIEKLDEEMSENSRKIEDKMKMIDICVNDVKMSTSGLNLLKKNI